MQRLEIHGNSLYSTAGRKIRVWDLTTFRCRKNIHTQDDGGALRALALGQTGTIYVAGQVTTLHFEIHLQSVCTLMRIERCM